MGFGFGVGFLTPDILALPSNLEILPASLPGGPPSPLMADGVQRVEGTLSHDPIGGLCVCWAINLAAGKTANFFIIFPCISTLALLFVAFA